MIVALVPKKWRDYLPIQSKNVRVNAMKALDAYRSELEKRCILGFAVLCALFAYPVIAADIMHRDDVWRVVSGQYASR